MSDRKPEVADDGAPLGTLVVPDLGPVPPKRRTAEELRFDAALAAAQLTAEEPEPSVEQHLELFEGYSDPEKKERARRAFIVDRRDAADIAKELAVPVDTVAQWVHEGRWNRIVARTMGVLSANEGVRLTKFRIENRERLLKQQVEDAELQQTKLREQIRSGEMRVTKSSAEALGALARVQNAAMGVAESGAVVESADSAAEKAKKAAPAVVAPLVMVFPGKSGIPVLGKRKGGVIDVEVKEVKE